MPKNPRSRSGARTSNYGSPARANHDASPFYQSRLHQHLPTDRKVKRALVPGGRACVNLVTYQGEVVLAPFLGGGQSALAAIPSGRSFVGYEINPQCAALAEKRIRISPFPSEDPAKV